MILQTARLELIPLKLFEFKLWLEDISRLERKLNIKYKATPLEGFFKQIVEDQYKITLSDPENYIWHSFFFLIRKSDRDVVGLLDFKDIPSNDGENVKKGTYCASC